MLDHAPSDSIRGDDQVVVLQSLLRRGWEVVAARDTERGRGDINELDQVRELDGLERYQHTHISIELVRAASAPSL